MSLKSTVMPTKARTHLTWKEVLSHMKKETTNKLSPSDQSSTQRTLQDRFINI